MGLKALVRSMVMGAMMLCFAAGVRADGLEYRYEVGAMIGGATYFGMLYVFRDKYLYMIVNKISMKILKKEVI